MTKSEIIYHRPVNAGLASSESIFANPDKPYPPKVEPVVVVTGTGSEGSVQRGFFAPSEEDKKAAGEQKVDK